MRAGLLVGERDRAEQLAGDEVRGTRGADPGADRGPGLWLREGLEVSGGAEELGLRGLEEMAARTINSVSPRTENTCSFRTLQVWQQAATSSWSVVAADTTSLMTIKTFSLGGDLTINRIGFGAMRLAAGTFDDPPRAPENGITVLRRSVEPGVNHIDTAGFYRRDAVRANELIRRAPSPYRDDLVIATKVGRCPPQTVCRVGRRRLISCAAWWRRIRAHLGSPGSTWSIHEWAG